MIKIHIKHPMKTANGDTFLEVQKELRAEEFVCIFGESGAGKTTILRIIAGLIKPEFGYIKVNDELWQDSHKNIFLPPQKRKVGFVFQDYALFSHLNVRENLAFALKGEQKKIDELLELMNLKSLEKAYPHQLSGGQAQRVALARALAFNPQILLLDEPLSALDFKMRGFLQDELLKLTRHFKLTTLLVSHDIGEIYKLASRVIKLEYGKCIQDGKPSELFSRSNFSAKLQFSATVLEIKKADILIILTLLINQELVKITLSEAEFKQNYASLKIGDTLIIAGKAFNPLILKLEK
ncbi:molybdenum ABC transporter ATP-binding protein [Campylobacter sp. MIT 12-8780]|uniref:sulfate/molybdate ABC transporter ATP-binding protein n=1 Tax=unclassified Campylobacter TaxID=2593542 RepID=UPI0010F756E5|nr:MULTISPECIES: ATP-binding cassette domain-containing protein [unclassified Campylobacter]NDJ26822.1 ATP-binding cassette domain-containing protein [Campylobacter sp. MIT 19-121]TKX30107.1 molybdenum ABC transporter ATP-binding protein [Campylobacter sp. MIT 12-5580]TQR42358.1 molybdenum ABC transporter ATP-binding protein [Campylobacter sp. MIT 12-8780]